MGNEYSTNWKREYKKELNHMWQSHQNKCLKKYNDRYDHKYNCQLSEKEYINSITYNQLQSFLKRNKEVESLVLKELLSNIRI